MALFDKLKEKVNQAVDSVKGELAKAEQERLEREKALKEQKEREKKEKEEALKQEEERKRKEKEEAINAFYSSVNVDEELDYIFSVLEKGGKTTSNFEKGVEHLFSKIETTLKKEEVMFILKKALFTRAFTDIECRTARVVAIDYFMYEVVRAKLLNEYVSFAVSREKGSRLIEFEEPFIKALYGTAGHAFNYLKNDLQQEEYQTMTPADFLPVIEDSDVLKSYTDDDPFAVQEVRAKWAKDIYNAPLEMVRSSELKDLLAEEEHMDAMYYLTYVVLCENEEDCVENASVEMIASVYTDYLKEIYSRISS